MQFARTTAAGRLWRLMAVSADSALSVVIELNAQADVPGLTDADLQTHAEAAKNHCPIAKALTWPQISLHAQQVK